MKQNKQKFEPLYEMVNVITLLSNYFNNELVEDSKQIINLISDIYDLDDNVIEEYQDIIINKMSIVTTLNELEYNFTRRKNSFESTKDEIYYDIKSEILHKCAKISTNNDYIRANDFAFLYRYHLEYNRDYRFYQLHKISVTGQIDCLKVIAICYYLGIGVEKNIDKAINNFKSCLYWGDIFSAKALAFIYSGLSNNEQLKIYDDLYELMNEYFYDGVTVIEEKIGQKYTIKAKEIYCLISSIMQDIVLKHKIIDVDLSFVEIMKSPQLTYKTKMGYINNYEKYGWREETNSSTGPLKKISFI